MSDGQMPAAINARLPRIAIGVVGIVSVLVAAGLVFEVRPVTSVWPYSVTHLTYVFLGSVVLAFAVPLLWVAWTGQFAALAGAGMTSVSATIGVAVGLVPAAESEPRLLGYAIAATALGLAGLAGTAWALRRPFADRRETPQIIRGALAAFAVILLVGGGLIVAGTPNILPWQIARESSVLVGWIFISDAAYFAYGAGRPLWANAAGQLLAFAAYDIVLLAPLADHWSTVIPGQRVSLAIYLAVLVISLAVATFAFLLHPATRIRVLGSVRAEPISPR